MTAVMTTARVPDGRRSGGDGGAREDGGKDHGGADEKAAADFGSPSGERERRQRDWKRRSELEGNIQEALSEADVVQCPPRLILTEADWL